MSDNAEFNQPEEQAANELEQSAQEPQEEITTDQVERAIYEFECEQNMALGAMAGLVAGIVAAALWAGVAIGTGYQIGWLAIGVGFVVGYAVKTAGKGLANTYGILGGAIALLSLVIGNFLTVIGFDAKFNNQPFFTELLSFDYSTMFTLIKDTTQPMDFLFYAIAVWAGYGYSIRKLTEAELLAKIDEQG